jgi:hypothetical protein
VRRSPDQGTRVIQGTQLCGFAESSWSVTATVTDGRVRGPWPWRRTRCLLTLILSLPLSLGPFLRFTGLPSRSALVAPPLQLAALRWRGSADLTRAVSATFGRLDGLLVPAVRASPGRASRGCPPRECAQAASKRMRHILKDRTPAVAPLHVSS